MRSASAEGGTTRSCAAAPCGSSSDMAASAETERQAIRHGAAGPSRWNRDIGPARAAIEGRRRAAIPCRRRRPAGRGAKAGAYSFGRQRPQIGDDGVEIGVRHLGVVLEAHRALERRAVLPLALGDRGLDLGVGPVADAGGLVRGDVARLRHAPGPGEFAAALAERIGEIRPAAAARTACGIPCNGRWWRDRSRASACR